MLVYDVFDVISLILIRIGSSLIVHDFLELSVLKIHRFAN